MTKFKKTTLILSLSLLACLMLPASIVAQNLYDGSRGLFGRGNTETYSRENEAISANITFENFGQETPLGNGLLIIMAASAGYFLLKRKDQEK